MRPVLCVLPKSWMTFRCFNNTLCNHSQVHPLRTTMREDMRYYANAGQQHRPYWAPSSRLTPAKFPTAPVSRRSGNCNGILPRQSSIISRAHLLSLRILLDASARRFQAKKIYMRMVAAARWVNLRSGILQGQTRHAGHTAALRQADQALQQVSNRIPVRLDCKTWAKFQFNAPRSSQLSQTNESSMSYGRKIGRQGIGYKRTLHCRLFWIGSVAIKTGFSSIDEQPSLRVSFWRICLCIFRHWPPQKLHEIWHFLLHFLFIS